MEETTKDKLLAVLDSMWAEQQAVLSSWTWNSSCGDEPHWLNQLARMSPKAGTVPPHLLAAPVAERWHR